jgi:hypothetical protein
MSDFNWTCPHCERAVTITDQRFSTNRHSLAIKNKDGRQSLLSTFIVCPNPECTKYTLSANLFKSTMGPNGEQFGDLVEEWKLIPRSSGKTFPSYIPKSILDDYNEACQIVVLSPKASATLSRRCLQGVLRDFWQVKPGRLVDEIDQIKTQVDPLTWDAIDALRKLGNIGAHMEKDINLIVEVDPEEAALLIGLIETLLKDWYVLREERKQRMGVLVQAATKKNS